MQRYETDYGIFNHDNDDDPLSLALVRMHWSENVIRGSRMRERMERFEEFGVSQKFGLSWIDFKNLPSFECDQILEIAAKRQNDQNDVVNNALNQINNT